MALDGAWSTNQASSCKPAGPDRGDVAVCGGRAERRAGGRVRSGLALLVPQLPCAGSRQ